MSKKNVNPKKSFIPQPLDCVLNYQLHSVMIPGNMGGDGPWRSWYIWEIICKTWFLDFYRLLEIVTILSSPALERQRHQGMDLCRMKQPSLSLFFSSIWAVRRRKWDFTCTCPCILGHQRYDKGNHSVPVIDLAYCFCQPSVGSP